jgi:methylthioribose-1-phosphate isomerase
VAVAIERLAVRGAPAIGIAAAYGLALGVGETVGPDVATAFEASRKRLRRTRPTAVNLAWALERAGEAFERAVGEGTEAVPGVLLDTAHAIAREQLEADERIAEHGAALFAPGDRVLTHCNTGPLATGGAGTAGGVIAAAWRAGCLREVWVDETRPLLQGARLTAWELDREGIPFRLVADAAVGTLMARGLVERVIVGADRIAANGDVANKIGTYTVASLAQRHGVPFYVAAPLSTVDPGTPTGAEIPIEERDGAELLSVGDVPVALPGARAANWAFDVTPADLVTAIVTERGVLEPPYGPAIAAALRGR